MRPACTLKGKTTIPGIVKRVPGMGVVKRVPVMAVVK